MSGRAGSLCANDKASSILSPVFLHEAFISVRLAPCDGSQQLQVGIQPLYLPRL